MKHVKALSKVTRPMKAIEAAKMKPVKAKPTAAE